MEFSLKKPRGVISLLGAALLLTMGIMLQLQPLGPRAFNSPLWLGVLCLVAGLRALRQVHSLGLEAGNVSARWRWGQLGAWRAEDVRVQREPGWRLRFGCEALAVLGLCALAASLNSDLSRGEKGCACAWWLFALYHARGCELLSLQVLGRSFRLRLSDFDDPQGLEAFLETLPSATLASSSTPAALPA